MINGYWVDGCLHSEGSYIGSFSINNEKYDLYYFPSTEHGMEVCIRYGQEGHEYLSPGSMEYLKRATNTWKYSTVHITAYSMLLDHLRKVSDK